jgi:hypothetical protein
MTLNDIELDVYRRLDYADTPPPSVKNRIDGFINQRHRQLLASDRMRPLRLATTTLTSIPLRSSYGLPFGCARVSRVTDQDNDVLLGTQTYEWVREHAPNPQDTTGTPTHWIPLGFSPVATRPSTAALWMASLDDPPGTAITFTLVLVGDYNGRPGQTVTVSPVMSSPDPTVRNPITLPVGFTPSDIVRFSADTVLAGSVAIFDTGTQGTGNLISQISAGQTKARYYRVGLYPVPSAAILYWIDYEREIRDLTAPLDEPLLPVDFHDLIAVLARMDEYEFKSDDRWQATRDIADERTKQLRSWVENHDAYRFHAIPVAPTTSRLGPWFPSGT